MVADLQPNIEERIGSAAIAVGEVNLSVFPRWAPFEKIVRHLVNH